MAPSRKIRAPSKTKNRPRRTDLARKMTSTRPHRIPSVVRRVAHCPDFNYSRRFVKNLYNVYRMCKQYPKQVFVIHKNNNFAKTQSLTNSTWAKRSSPREKTQPRLLRIVQDKVQTCLGVYSQLAKDVLDTIVGETDNY